MRQVDLAIVGAGPAGCAAAVQAARLGVTPVLFDRDGQAGGLIENAREIENYPGLEAPLPGRLFAERLREGLARFGVAVERAGVDTIERRPAGFVLRGSIGAVAARAVIVAVGTQPRRLGLPGENSLVGRRVFYEVKRLLDSPRRSLAVVGGGEAAVDYALSLAAAGSTVRLYIRDEAPRAARRLCEQLRAEARVEVETGCELRQLAPTEGGVKVGDRTFEAVVVAVGRTSAAAPLLARVEAGRGLYLAGDARRGALGQVGMAVGDGLETAALAVIFLAGTA